MTLCEEVLSKQELIDQLDLEPITVKLMCGDDGSGLSLEEADLAVIRYRQFLTLCALYPDQPIVPTRQIDMVWHTHILDTAKYRYDCDQVFGRFLDHFPYFGMRGADDAMQLVESFAATCDLFLLHFGTLPNGSATACGDNCGGSLCENPACSGNSCKGTVDEGEALAQERPRPVR